MTSGAGSLVLGGSSPRGHHHSPPDGVDGVGCQTGGDGNDPSQQEGDEDIGVIADEDWLQTVVEAEVETTVDEDTHGRDDKASVQALDAVSLEGLDVDIDQPVELTLSLLGIVGQPCSGIVERVDEQQRQSSSRTSGGDVGAKLLPVGRSLGGLLV